MPMDEVLIGVGDSADVEAAQAQTGDSDGQPRPYERLQQAHASSMPPVALVPGYVALLPDWMFEDKLSPSFYFAVATTTVALATTAPRALASWRAVDAAQAPPFVADGGWRLLGSLCVALFGWAIIGGMLKVVGPWPLRTFTMLSNFLLALRATLGLGARLTGWRFLAALASAITGPTLVGNSMVVTIWWLVVAPIIFVLYFRKGKAEGDFAKFEEFKSFNKQPFLLGVHLLNLPVAAVDYLLTGPSRRPLVYCDLWLVVAYGTVHGSLRCVCNP